MKNFGIIKSRIEKILVDSYQNKTIKESFGRFRELVLQDKNLVSMFYLYDQLSSKNGIGKDIANDYINECISKFESLKLSKEKVNSLNAWTSSISTENLYEDVDRLFDDNILNIESKINSKKRIFETITSKQSIEKEVINIPLKTSLSIANQSMYNFMQNLTESEKKEFLEVAQLDSKKLYEEYESLKDSTIQKLENLMESDQEGDIKQKLQETINKIKNDKIDKLNYYRLRKLNETI